MLEVGEQAKDLGIKGYRSVVEIRNPEEVTHLAESLLHERLVGKLIGWLNSDGFELICASCDGYKQCNSIDGYVPDCMGRRNGLIAIGEAKTVGDIDNERTKEQIRIGANGVTNREGWKDQWIPFYIAIPSGSDEELQKVLKELGYLNKPNIKGHSYQV